MEEYVQIGDAYVQFDNIKSLGSKLNRPALFRKMLKRSQLIDKASWLTTNSLCTRTQYWFGVQNTTNLYLQSQDAEVIERHEFEGHTFFRVHTTQTKVVRFIFTWNNNPTTVTVHLSSPKQTAQDLVVPNVYLAESNTNEQYDYDSMDQVSYENTNEAQHNLNDTSTNLPKRRVNLIILVPPGKEMFDALHNLLIAEPLDFQFEVGSNDQWLYSRQELYDWFVLLFPYHDGRAIRLRQYLTYASETILCLFDPNQADLVVVNQILHENQCLLQTAPQKAHLSALFTSTQLQLHDINLEARTTLSAIKAAEYEMTHQSLAVGVVQAQYHPKDLNLLRQYLIHWLATPVFTTINIYICFQLEQSVTTLFTNTRQKILDAVYRAGLPTDAMQITVVHGSILAYVSCPCSVFWHMMTAQDKLFAEFQLCELQLTSIYEATINDVDNSLAHEDNAPYKEELLGLKQTMIKEGAKQDADNRHNIFFSKPRINEKALAFFNQGKEQFEQGNYIEALAAFSEAEGIQPNNVLVIQYNGATKQKLGDYEGALDDLKRADQLEPNNAFTLEHLAIVMYLVSDFNGALEAISKAIEQDPHNKSYSDLKDKIKIECDMNAAQAENKQDRLLNIPFSELTMIKSLGEGRFGEVWLAEWRGIKVAIKSYKNVTNQFLHEVPKKLMLLRHRCIVIYLGYTNDPETNTTMLVMEYMRHGSLDDLLFKQNVKMSFTDVVQISLDVAKGINFLHTQTPIFIHGDLKSASILLHANKTHAKIADFGVAKAIAGIGVGSEMSPDIIDAKRDIFSFGAVLYEMFTNEKVHMIEEHDQHFTQRIRANVSNKEFAELIAMCCAVDPKQRPTMNIIIKVLKDLKKNFSMKKTTSL